MALGDTVGVFMAKEIQAGRLLPDEFLFQSVEATLGSILDNQGIVCAGIIRTISQQRGLTMMWREHGFAQPLGILLEVSEGIGFERALLRKRSDDTEEALQER